MCYSKGATKNQSSAGTEMNGQSNAAHGSPEWKQLKCLSAEEWGVMHMWEYYSVKKQWNLDTYHAVNESEDTKLSERSRGWRWGGKVMCSELFLVKHSEEVALQRHTLLICIYRAWEENGIGNGGCWKWFPLGEEMVFWNNMEEVVSQHFQVTKMTLNYWLQSVWFYVLWIFSWYEKREWRRLFHKERCYWIFGGENGRVSKW